MSLHEHLLASVAKLSEKHKPKSPFTPPKKGLNFKSAQSEAEHEGYSKKIAGAIIASRSRNASAAAKKANPRLERV